MNDPTKPLVDRFVVEPHPSLIETEPSASAPPSMWSNVHLTPTQNTLLKGSNISPKKSTQQLRQGPTFTAAASFGLHGQGNLSYQFFAACRLGAKQDGFWEVRNCVVILPIWSFNSIFYCHGWCLNLLVGILQSESGAIFTITFYVRSADSLSWLFNAGPSKQEVDSGSRSSDVDVNLWLKCLTIFDLLCIAIHVATAARLLGI